MPSTYSISSAMAATSSSENPSAGSLVPATPRVQLKQVAPTSDDCDVEYIMVVDTPRMSVLRRSSRLARITDDSSLLELQWCDDRVRCVHDGRELLEPRVLISRNAKEKWDEGMNGSFAYVTCSLPRISKSVRISPMPEVCSINPLPW